MRIITATLLFGFAILTHAQRFVRFIATDGKEYTGDAILNNDDTDTSHSKQAHVITGDILGDFKITKQVKNSSVATGAREDTHCKNFGTANVWEGLTNDQPWTSLAAPNGPVPVTSGYQNQTTNGTFFVSSMDYESELVVVIKSKAFNITEDQALDHVLGYAAGYDVSHRGWQIDRGGQPQPQFSMGKDADGWAPWGPAIVSKSLIPDPQALSIWAKVNGVTMQNDTTANMIFGVAQLVSFFSMGITLWPGDIIFTGTPSGVQLGKANPVWLTNGDVVEVSLP
ncbi:Fumarylacetoacetate hydrolase domain-containing protein 2 [Mycena indigotica]|uniref:Fumarylacetoacetate hydrolase domain-containing protein 2 n=1 Tax=Mycena indigotica TaxID=2126181 RepID=A0A8H6SFX3_9AGAR|nr:Fumarylacetoacetate hydrolase domain-containing protein 2 [Mycena indigotica]KAF7297115.1 Fumarylacetoacetate hydrolase domain-containing protein 2 [Mycena indigotica]